MAIDAALRPLRMDDSERLLTWRNLPEVSRWMYTDHVISAEEHAIWFEMAMTSSDRRYWIVECDGEPVGTTNLTGLSPGGQVELGYYLASPAVRGRGLGAFVEYLVIETAFGELGVDVLFSEVLFDNDASRKLLERLGFKQVAVLAGRALKAGQPADALRFRLSADEWVNLRQSVGEALRARGYPV